MRYLLLIFASLTIITVSGEIIEVYPNPFNPDAEYVKVRCNGTCVLSDGEGNVSLSKGIYYVSKNASAFEESFGFKPDLEFEGKFALANKGDEIILYEDGRVDEFTYKNADRGLIYYREGNSWKFRYEGWTNYKPVKDHVFGKIILTPANLVFEADTIVSYTFTTDKYVVGNYTLYLDANPVGGIPINEIEIAREHKTHFLKTPIYKFFHWKFGLKDDVVLITTENWKWDKIGFIVIFESEKVSNFLRGVLKHDEIYSSEPLSFGEVKGLRSLGGRGRVVEFECNVTVFVLPDYNPILDLMKKARERIVIVAPYIHFKNTGILEVLRNCTCKIEVYTSDENTAYSLKEFSRRNNLNLDAKILRNIHGKMIVIDDRAIITSANLDEYGLFKNREIGVIVEGEVVKDLVEAFDREEDYNLHAIVILSIVVLIVYMKLRR